MLETTTKKQPIPLELKATVMELALRTIKSQMEDRKNPANDLYLNVINVALEEVDDV